MKCRDCRKNFIGAIYEGQPNDLCYDCFKSPTQQHPELWAALTSRIKEKYAHDYLQTILALIEEGVLRLPGKKRKKRKKR